MDIKTLHSRKGKSRNARLYNRQNQSTFGKVCSTVKGLLNPTSWFNVSHWIGNSEKQQGSSSDDIEKENINYSSDIVSQSVSNECKRLRLRLDEHNFQDVASIQSSETQTWPKQPSQNLYEPMRIVSPSSSATQSFLMENKKFMTVVNDLNSNRGLRSSSCNPSLKFQRPYLTVSHTNQPNFNLSSFAGPSSLKKTSSAFYEDKTTFGNASALQKTPACIVPYQADRSSRNQIRIQEQNSKDNLKQTSSAAKRIFLTLDKISSPVSDGKTIPNFGTSSNDLSLYLTPPKSRWNSQMTPSVASKGPPIADINAIVKIAILKNYDPCRLKSTPRDESVKSAELKTQSFDILQPKTLEKICQTKSGSKMKNKLNQHHISSKERMAKHEIMDTDTPPLKNIQMPITSLPFINFGSKHERTSNSFVGASGFTFSKPIEHHLSVSNTRSISTLASATWECSACWVRNPQNRTSCLACETPMQSKETKNSFVFKIPENPQTISTVSSASQSPSTGLNADISTNVLSFQAPVFGVSKTKATPVMSETNVNSFPANFSMNTSLSFNFGATSTPAGPFQSAASCAASKAAFTFKAVRRITRGRILQY